MIDRGEEVIVGVNKYRKDKEDPIDILEIDNVKPSATAQVARLERIRATRDQCRNARQGAGGCRRALRKRAATCWRRPSPPLGHGHR